MSQEGLISVSMLGTDGLDCSTSAHSLNVSSFNPAERMSHYGDGMIAWLLARAQLSPITAASDVLSTNALHPSFSCPTLEDANMMMTTLLNTSTWQTAELHDAMTPACCNARFGAPLQFSCAGTIPPRALPLCGAVASLALDATPDGRNDTEVNAGPARSSVLGAGASDRVADTARGKGMHGNYDSDSNDSTCTTNAAGVICATETLAFVSFKDGFASHDSPIRIREYGTSELICPTLDDASFETCAANVSLSREITVRAGRTLV